MKKLFIIIPILYSVILFFPSLSIGAEEIDMVFVKGGCFEMGDAGGDGEDDERPVHEVCVDDFYIGKYEVTQSQWHKIAGYNPAYFKGCDNCPVETIDWDEVQEFINKLNQKTGKKYRLPTDAEWEYAARSGGKKERFAGFSDESKLSQYANFCDDNCEFEWKVEGQNDGYRNTAPVGSYEPNGLGLYDMSGNVWEWISDWYDENYYKNSPKDNPNGPSGGPFHVLRGGSWGDTPWDMRTATRNGRGRVGQCFCHFGFRLALSPQ